MERVRSFQPEVRDWTGQNGRERGENGAITEGGPVMIHIYAF